MDYKSKKTFRPRKTGEKELNMWRAVARMNGIPVEGTEENKPCLGPENSPIPDPSSNGCVQEPLDDSSK